MIKVLIPVFIVAIIGLTVWAVQRNQSKAGTAKELARENERLHNLVNKIDRDALAEYTVTNSPFAGTVLDAIRRFDSNKEIA